jgi:hypothetical protein
LKNLVSYKRKSNQLHLHQFPHTKMPRYSNYAVWATKGGFTLGPNPIDMYLGLQLGLHFASGLTIGPLNVKVLGSIEGPIFRKRLACR